MNDMQFRKIAQQLAQKNLAILYHVLPQIGMSILARAKLVQQYQWWNLPLNVWRRVSCMLWSISNYKYRIYSNCRHCYNYQLNSATQTMKRNATGKDLSYNTVLRP